MTFNQNQLATWEQARALAKEIDAFRQRTGVPMGGGVRPETSNWETSGIFVPTWVGGPGGFPEPADAEHNLYWLHYRYVNGRVGNVGLILDGLQRYGNNEWPVFMTLNNNDLS